VLIQHEVCAVSFWPQSAWTRITVTEIGLNCCDGTTVAIVQHEVYAVSFWPLSDCARITVTEIGLFVVMVQRL